MPWNLTKSYRIEAGSLDRWIYNTIPSLPGGFQDAMKLVPDSPPALSWTRAGFYVVGFQVAGQGLMGQTLDIPFGPTESPPPLLGISKTILGDPVAASPQVEAPLIAISLNRWVGPSTIELWTLT